MKRAIRKTACLAAGLAVLLMSGVSARAMEDSLVIVTSFPKDLTSVFKKAFEKKHPA